MTTLNRWDKKLSPLSRPNPFSFKFYVIKEEVYNAFAIPAGYIFINSGLMAAMTNEDELAGILSHEISHVVCRHISQRIERSKKIDLATMAGMVAGIFLGVATGSADATQSMILGSAAAGQAATLGYSRDDEMQADQLGLGYLDKAGYSAHGLLDMLQKIRSRQWFGSDVVPTYLMTHPAVEQRIVDIDAWMASHPGRDKTAQRNPQGQIPFRRMVLRLRALYSDAGTAEQFFHSATQQGDDPEADYGYSLLLSRLGRRSEAESWLRKALARKAMDPVFLTELGRLYFLDGRYQDALGILNGVELLPGSHSEALFYIGRSYSALGESRKAVDNLETLLDRRSSYTDAYYYLGEAYSNLGDDANAHYFLGMFYYHKGDPRLCSHHLTKARQMLKDPEKLETIKKVLEDIRPEPGQQG